MATSAENCQQGDPCLSYQGTFRFVDVDAAHPKRLSIAIAGTFPNDAGTFLKAPKAPLVFELVDHAYVLAAGSARENAASAHAGARSSDLPRVIVSRWSDGVVSTFPSHEGAAPHQQSM